MLQDSHLGGSGTRATPQTPFGRFVSPSLLHCPVCPIIPQCCCLSLHLSTWFSVLRTSHCGFLEECLGVTGRNAQVSQAGDGGGWEVPSQAAAGGSEQLLQPRRPPTILWKLKLAFQPALSLSLLCDLEKVLVCLQTSIWGKQNRRQKF